MSSKTSTKESLYNRIKELHDNGGIPCFDLNGDDGSAWFGGGSIGFAGDGSGWLASAAIQWTAEGHLLMRGMLVSNYNGNRIVIDPVTRSIKMISKDNKVVLNASFYDHEGLETGSDIYSYTYDKEGKIKGAMRIMGGRVMLYKGDPEQHTSNCIMDIGMQSEDRIGWFIDKEAMPKKGEDVYSTQVYVDGDFLKLK